MARTKPTSKRTRKQTPPPPTWDEKLINRLMPYRVEIIGLLLFVVAVITIMATLGVTKSSWLSWWTSLLCQSFGWGVYPLFLILAALGVHIMLRKVERPYRVRPTQIIGLELILLPALALSHQLSGSTMVDAYQGQAGGLVGWALSEPVLDFFGPVLTGLLYASLIVWGIALLVGLKWHTIHHFLWHSSRRTGNWAAQIAPPEPEELPQQRALSPARPEPVTPVKQEIVPEPAVRPSLKRRSRQLPPITLLEPGASINTDDTEVQQNKDTIERTLADFGIPAEVTQIRRGPAVTQYGVSPGYIERSGPDGETTYHKVRIGQIASLRRDIALALAAPRLRIQAPIPGRGVVGIEVPNNQVNLVRLRDVIESKEFRALKAPLAVGLGRNVSGETEAIDLAKLPHLLIAGTTGSGKSICINAFVSCLVFNNTPEQLRIIMIDPKKVELIRFNGLPHMIGRVEVEADRAVGVLRWLTAEMDRRYETFAKVGARNLNGYNRRIRQQDKDARPLPYIAVFIDELADLMHIYPGDVERTLCRLAQMARATGIHLVVATQRPSTDVITGLIKANFPARLSFNVASGIDSRVILDSTGAEQLLGRGDMLFLAPDASGPMRVQGVFVTDNEVEQLVTFWKKMRPDHQPGDPPWESLIAKHALLDETDTLLESAIELAKKNDHLSASYLQRRLRLGYPRAARLMEHLYEMGLVEDPKTGGKTRKTYTDEDDDPLDRILSERE
ncbi:MAG: DNA translocase FtsK 4TM domain-containing protein [Candidatus Promineifilaceae bacterium]|nr:DNA translocase FtsK 4TM domain-containing protein [Candidatus Promineifilaceae bacterium]